LLLGQTITVFGSSLLRFVLSLYVLDITGRADLFAVLLAISSIPILLSPIGGAISDRFNRKILMVIYDTVCCWVTLCFLIVMMCNQPSVFMIGTLMVILGIVGAMETPNSIACIPQLCTKEKLESSNGIIQAVQSLSGIAAPILGGVLYGAFGLRPLVLISSVAFALAAIMESFIELPYVKRTRPAPGTTRPPATTARPAPGTTLPAPGTTLPPATTSRYPGSITRRSPATTSRSGSMIHTLAADLKDGFTYVWRNSFIRNLMVIAALMNLVLAPCVIVAAPLILRMTLKSTDTLYGVGMGLIEFAMILGALLVGVFSKKIRIRTIWRWILGAALLFAPLALSLVPRALGLGFWPSFSAFTLCIMLISAAMTILSIFLIARIQAKTPTKNLGKVMAIIQTVAQCAAPVGQILYGISFEQFADAVYIPLLFGGLLTVGIALMSKTTLKKEDIVYDSNHINA
jgi:MFS family permease